jgi:hypothetical protein
VFPYLLFGLFAGEVADLSGNTMLERLFFLVFLQEGSTNIYTAL